MRRDRLFLLDIVEACEKIARYVDGKTSEQFFHDEVLFDASCGTSKTSVKQSAVYPRKLGHSDLMLSGLESSDCAIC